MDLLIAFFMQRFNYPAIATATKLKFLKSCHFRDSEFRRNVLKLIKFVTLYILAVMS